MAILESGKSDVPPPCESSVPALSHRYLHSNPDSDDAKSRAVLRGFLSEPGCGLFGDASYGRSRPAHSLRRLPSVAESRVLRASPR
jgi:hypothetical protein